MSELMPHQVQGVDWLSQAPRAMLLDEPGLGKTAQLLLSAARVGQRLVVLCPAWLRRHWEAEAERWVPGLNVEACSIDKRRYPFIDSMSVVVIDESHYIKTPQAKRTMRAKWWLRQARPRAVWFATGTPIVSSPVDLWSQLTALDPWFESQLGGLHEFINHYCVEVYTGFGRRVVGMTPAGRRDLPHMLRTWSLRRTKATAGVVLPPMREDVLPIEVSARDLDEGRRVAAEMDVLTDYGVELMACGMAKAPQLAKWLANRLLSEQAEPAVAFCHHRAVARRLQECLLKEGVATSYVDGSTRADDRVAAIDSLGRESRCLVATIATMGVGINLTVATLAVFAELAWTPAAVEQASMRIHRISQTRPVEVYYTGVPGTIDEEMALALKRKERLVSTLTDEEQAKRPYLGRSVVQ